MCSPYSVSWPHVFFELFLFLALSPSLSPFVKVLLSVSFPWWWWRDGGGEGEEGGQRRWWWSRAKRVANEARAKQLTHTLLEACIIRKAILSLLYLELRTSFLPLVYSSTVSYAYNLLLIWRKRETHIHRRIVKVRLSERLGVCCLWPMWMVIVAYEWFRADGAYAWVGQCALLNFLLDTVIVRLKERQRGRKRKRERKQAILSSLLLLLFLNSEGLTSSSKSVQPNTQTHTIRLL